MRRWIYAENDIFTRNGINATISLAAAIQHSGFALFGEKKRIYQENIRCGQGTTVRRMVSEPEI